MDGWPATVQENARSALECGSSLPPAPDQLAGRPSLDSLKVRTAASKLAESKRHQAATLQGACGAGSLLAFHGSERLPHSTALHGLSCSGEPAHEICPTRTAETDFRQSQDLSTPQHRRSSAAGRDEVSLRPREPLQPCGFSQPSSAPLALFATRPGAARVWLCQSLKNLRPQLTLPPPAAPGSPHSAGLGLPQPSPTQELALRAAAL